MMADKVKNEFQRFWIETAGKLRAYMFCACESWEDADDLTQDCYMRALRGWNQFNGSSSRQAWLFGIARRTCVDWFRKKNRRATIVASENLDELERIVPEKLDADDIERIWAAVKGLRTEQCQVIHLRFAAGLSYGEIAQALEVPIGTVRSRLHRALKGVSRQIRERENGT